MKDVWWIDLIEGELFNDESDKNEFNTVKILPHSALENSQTFRQLSTLKKFIRSEMEAVVPEDGHYFENLQNKIMSNIRQYECQRKKENLEREKSESQSYSKLQTAKFYFSLGL